MQRLPEEIIPLWMSFLQARPRPFLGPPSPPSPFPSWPALAALALSFLARPRHPRPFLALGRPFLAYRRRFTLYRSICFVGAYYTELWQPIFVFLLRVRYEII